MNAGPNISPLLTIQLGLTARLDSHDSSLAEARKLHSSVVALGDGDRLVLGDDLSLNHLVKQAEGWA